MDSTGEGRGRWALLVGIDRYPKLGLDWQLDGCVNDVQIMKDALVRRFDFSEDRITVLLNEQATRVGVLAAMEELVRRVGQDEIVVVHYSGHGSQRPDGPEQDELDGWDETLVPHDSGRKPFPNRDITDDEIYDWLQRLTALTPYITLIFDCCHSGTVTREPWKIRIVPREDRSFEEMGAPPVGTLRTSDGRKEEGPSGWLPLGERYVLFAASSSAESANEILTGESKRIPHGALTYFLVQELMSPSFNGATCTEVFERLAPRIRAQCEYQHPQLEGARDREVFGLRTIRPMSFLSVLSRQEDRVILDAGTACGLKAGSRWLAYGPGTRSVSSDSVLLGTVEILSVGVTTSEARVLEETPPHAVVPGARAIEGFHCLERAGLTIEIVAPPGHPSVAALAERIAGSKLLRLAHTGSEADIRAFLLGPRSRVRGSDPVPGLGALSEETWVAMRRDGNLLGPALPRRNPNALEILTENLESLARLRTVAELRNPDSKLGGLVLFDLYRLEEGACVMPLQIHGERVFHADDHLVLEVENRSERPLFIYVLDIGLTGRVALAYPTLGANELLERGQKVRLGTRPGEELTLFIPEDFDLLPECSRLAARETLKLFATTSPAEFRVLFEAGLRFRKGGVDHSLDSVLAATFGGGGYKSLRSGGEDWTTVERSFLLRENPSKASG
jgi:hypothetical protein